MTHPLIGSTWRRRGRGRVAMIVTSESGYPWVDLRMLDTGRLVGARVVDFRCQWERVRLVATAGGYDVRAWRARHVAVPVPAPVLP